MIVLAVRALRTNLGEVFPADGRMKLLLQLRLFGVIFTPTGSETDNFAVIEDFLF